MESLRERLVLSAALAFTFACRLDKLVNTPPAGGLGVSPSEVRETATAGSVAPRSVALAISGAGPDALSWVAHREGGASWLVLTDSTGAVPDTLRFQLDPTLLAPGTYHDAVIVVPDELGLKRVRVPVELRIDLPSPAR